MCMEGIEHNPVIYELTSEMAFRSEKVQVQVILNFECCAIIVVLDSFSSFILNYTLCYSN